MNVPQIAAWTGRKPIDEVSRPPLDARVKETLSKQSTEPRRLLGWTHQKTSQEQETGNWLPGQLRRVLPLEHQQQRKV